MQSTDARRLLNTVDDTTKGLPIVGGITSPLLKTVGGITDGLPIVSYPPTVFKKMIILTQVLSGWIRWRPRRRPRPSKTTTRRAAAIRTSSSICAPGSIPASSSGDETCTERGREEGEGCGEEKEADCVEEEAVGN